MYCICLLGRIVYTLRGMITWLRTSVDFGDPTRVDLRNARYVIESIGASRSAWDCVVASTHPRRPSATATDGYSLPHSASSRTKAGVSATRRTTRISGDSDVSQLLLDQ